MLETVVEVDENEYWLRDSVSTRSSETRMLERGMDALAAAVQGWSSGRPCCILMLIWASTALHDGDMGRPGESDRIRKGSIPKPIHLRSSRPANMEPQNSIGRRGSVVSRLPSSELATLACGSNSNRPKPCQPGNNTEQSVSQSTRFRMWEKSLLGSLRQIRLDEENRLVDRRESLHIEIPASPRSPIGRRLSELQTPPFPSRSNGEDRGAQDGHTGTPYASCGAYQLVYANSTLQDLHHQLDDSRRFLDSMIKLKVKSSGPEGKKKQATSTSETIVRMLNRLDNACGRILREQDLLADEMESRAPDEKWRSMLDTVMAMASILQVEGRVGEEALTSQIVSHE
ncbi:predicted protein [Verticillium alfalfae VaMs.102]|uniref:Predicted protein n=1 Tax=Verticillium alfalfae (strain VaMs.102 / ATCC MYA-4576 / FGSC 10136) TaxID=526221 RepID=C9SSP9_VERA1|nr:predicted protein [Verticillium alfalfae VaMs.102]EEY21814.1 predicted protein [Verticillium alfalfae VaMs.102]